MARGTSTTRINKEAIRLYRDIIRATRFYTWTNEKGEPWRQVLRVNARKEFESGTKFVIYIISRSVGIIII
jgi:hypothetical protein